MTEYPSQLFRVIYTTRHGEHMDFLCSYKISTVYNVRNRAYFCEICGDIWAKRRYEVLPWIEHLDLDRLWGVEQRKCHIHGDGHLLSDTEQIDYHVSNLPHALMLNELNCWLNERNN